MTKKYLDEDGAQYFAEKIVANRRATADLKADLETDLKAETDARASADTALQSKIEAEASARASAVEGEASARASADTALQSKIEAEASARASADTALQSNIDGKVSKSGDIMNGILGFDTQTNWPVIQVKTSAGAVGTTGSDLRTGVQFLDKNGKELAMWLGAYSPDGYSESACIANNNINGVSKSVRLSVIHNLDGTAYVSGITPPSNIDNSTKVPTTAWVYANPHIVRTIGNQRIEGLKTFADNVAISNAIYCMLGVSMKSTTADISDAAQTWSIPGFTWLDKNHKGVIWTKLTLDTASRTNVVMNYKYDNENSGGITLYSVDRANKKLNMYAPTPADSADNTEVATTAWTRALIVGKADASALDALGQTVAGKQDALTFDSAPTAESVNPVTSGGVYSALGGKVNKSGDTMTGSLEIAGRNKRVSVKCDFTDSTTYMQYGTFQVNGLTGSKCWLGAGGTSERTRASFFAQCGGKSKNISIEVRPDNEWVEGITPSDPSDNSTKIPTTAWIYANPHIVRTTGTQSISGNKTFTGSNTIQNTVHYKSGSIDITDSNKWAVFPDLRWEDKNGVRATDLRVATYLNNTTLVLFRFRLDDGTEADRNLYSVDRANKIIHMYAPTPADSADNTEVATTAWVRARIQEALGQ